MLWHAWRVEQSSAQATPPLKERSAKRAADKGEGISFVFDRARQIVTDLDPWDVANHLYRQLGWKS